MKKNSSVHPQGTLLMSNKKKTSKWMKPPPVFLLGLSSHLSPSQDISRKPLCKQMLKSSSTRGPELRKILGIMRLPSKPQCLGGWRWDGLQRKAQPWP